MIQINIVSVLQQQCTLHTLHALMIYILSLCLANKIIHARKLSVIYFFNLVKRMVYIRSVLSRRVALRACFAL